MVNIQPILLVLLSLVSQAAWSVNKPAEQLFGYQQSPRLNMQLFPQWLSVLERHVKEMSPEGMCSERQFNQCHLKQWQIFLKQVRSLPEMEKIRRVNEYANQKQYVLDIENYGIEDYWATPKEFLHQSGDCEDYAIIKMLSLKQLGFDINKIRVVVVQDTNLRIPHAVMSIDRGEDVLILDNQIKQVISHKNIYHYVPIYAVSEKEWWMYLPN